MTDELTETHEVRTPAALVGSVDRRPNYVGDEPGSLGGARSPVSGRAGSGRCCRMRGESMTEVWEVFSGEPPPGETGTVDCRYRYMTRIRTISALALAAAGVPLTSTPASATTITGFGNGAINNACANSGTAGRTNGVTTQAQGIGTALTAALPASAPANQCGNLGLQAVTGPSSRLLYQVSGGVRGDRAGPHRRCRGGTALSPHHRHRGVHRGPDVPGRAHSPLRSARSCTSADVLTTEGEAPGSG